MKQQKLDVYPCCEDICWNSVYRLKRYHI